MKKLYSFVILVRKQKTLNLTLHNMDTNITNISTPNSYPSTPNITLETIYNELKELNKNHKIIQDSINGLETTMNDYKIIIDGLTEENVELRNQNSMLNNRISNIEHSIDTEKQALLNHKMIISGINEKSDENLNDIVKKIGKALSVKIDESHINAVERQKIMSENSGIDRSIVVSFNDITKRNEILTKGKKKESRIKLKSLDPTANEDRSIYFSESLTSRRQYLCKLARDLKREGRIKYVWVNEGEILVRKNDGANAVKIKHKQQLENFK